jgi:hypothetical protein
MGKKYKTPSLHREPLAFEVTILDDEGEAITVTATGRHLRYHQMRGLNDLLIGEVHQDADPTGEQELKARRIKLKAVLERLEGLDESVAAGGVLVRGPDLDRFIDNTANADLVFASWPAYVEAVTNPRSFRRDADRRGEDGETEGLPSRRAPDAHMPGVRGAGAAAGEGATLPGGDGSGGVAPGYGEGAQSGAALDGPAPSGLG